MRDVADSPSIVPDLAAAVAVIRDLAMAKREGDADALNGAAPLFASIPGLRDIVHEAANGRTYAEIQGARSRDRKRVYEKRKVARARAYQKYRGDPVYRDMSHSDLKAWCGQRLVRDPTAPEKFLKTLERSQAIGAIDEGLALIATGRFELSR